MRFSIYDIIGLLMYKLGDALSQFKYIKYRLCIRQDAE
jgi:hypothetical protein